MKKLVDLHVHTSTKPILTTPGNQERNCWDIVIHAPSLGSQASLRQMHKTVGRLKDHTVVISWILMSLEKSMAEVMDCVNLHRVTPISHDVIDGIVNHTNYYAQLKRELNFILSHPELKPKGKKSLPLNFIQNAADIKKGHINIVFNIEGAHSLTKDMDVTSYKNNFQDLISQKVVVDGNLQTIRVLYLNLTHFEQNPFCNHCFALKEFHLGKKTIEIKDKSFIPQAKGISTHGKKLIELCYQNDRPVMVCLKHMSLVSRGELYDLRQDKGYTVPLIASHMGFTGMSRNDLPKYIETATKIHCKPESAHINDDFKYVNVIYKIDECRGVGGTFFNPWSINLFDEDILEVIKSGGVIGLLLDCRILGVPIKKKFKQYPEKFSVSEFNQLQTTWTNQVPVGSGTVVNDDYFTACDDSLIEKTIIDEQDEDKWRPNNLSKKEWHLRHLASHILHARSLHEKAFEHLALGSDYDGLISPIKDYRNFRKLYELEKELPPVLVALGKSMTEVQNSFGQRYRKNISLDLTQAKRVTHDIMYNNALKII